MATLTDGISVGDDAFPYVEGSASGTLTILVGKLLNIDGGEPVPGAAGNTIIIDDGAIL